MRKISVTYMLLNEDEERLRKITEKYKEEGLDITEDKMFESIIFTGSKYNIDSKFKLHE